VGQQEARYLVVGLGNPGPQYESTRHNIGFQVIDELSKRWGLTAFQKKFKGLIGEIQRGGKRVLLLKPQTYMNLSGDSVLEVAQFYKIPCESHLVVISDDLDLPVGSIRIRPSGGTGGHNGLKSITEVLGGENFPRIRMGIGRSATIPTESYVLTSIPAAEKKVYEDAVKLAGDAVEVFLQENIQKAMNLFNTRKTNEP